MRESRPIDRVYEPIRVIVYGPTRETLRAAAADALAGAFAAHRRTCFQPATEPPTIG
jgi:hypothetical protein